MRTKMTKTLVVCLALCMSLTIFTGCGKFTLEKAMKLYQDYGVQVSVNQKPYYKMIGAKDGVMFYMGGEVVKLYEFASEADYQKGLKVLKAMSKYPKRGLVVLDTNSKAAKEVFQKGN